MAPLILFFATPVALVFAYIFMRNGLIGRKNSVENAYGGIAALMQKRFDLIPQLVSCVKHFMAHERGLLEEITRLRSQAGTQSLGEKGAMELDQKMTAAIKSLMVSVENYPQLRSNENFLQLQAALNEVEEQLSAARRTYNAVVTRYNNGVEMFPSSIIASSMGYQRKTVYEAAEVAYSPVNVDALLKKSA